MAALLHPTAIIDPGADIGADVSIGPYAVVEGNVVIGDGTVIGPHAVIGEYTTIGKQCRIFHGAAVGLIPQDMKFRGEKTGLRIGDRTTIREFCTLNRGTAARGETVVGSDCLLLAYCHLAHDCVLGDHVIISNNLAMAGHIEVGNHVTIGGVCAFHQFVRIGDYAMIGAFSYVSQDIVPFALTGSDPVRVADVNRVKLERCGFSRDRIRDIRRAFRTLFREKLKLEDAVASLAKEYPGNEDVKTIIAFVEKSERGLLRMKGSAVRSDSTGQMVY
jgi:UDP-N-acetylglucosamine acyltransferase